MGKLLKYFKKLIPQEIRNAGHFINSALAVIYYGYPAKKLKVIGVTGTDGKTTTSTMIYHLLKTAGKKVALVSTVAAYIGDEEIETGFHVTTPDAWMLQKLLRRVADMQYDYVVLEVTSHGLDQHRLLGSNIKIGVLTNITQNEHLDYHKTYDNYVGAKAKLFQGVDLSIINKLDESYDKIKRLVNPKGKVIAYDLHTLPKTLSSVVRKRFSEEYNQLNATASYLVAQELGLDEKQIGRAFETFKGAKGRMEEVKNDRGIRIVIDFAHTPNSLKSVLTALKKQLPKGKKLIAMFGCTSERDDSKRPVMGEIATTIADVSIFTSDDPRFEDIHKINAEIAAGAEKNKNHNPYYSIPDRQEAIDFAINKLASKGDIFAACGKGHERSISIRGIEEPWSEKDAINRALSRKTI